MQKSLRTKKINVENVIKAFGFYSGKIKYDVKPIDLIDYNGEKCINVMSYGLDTKVETIGRQIAGKIPSIGHKAYDIAVVPVLCRSMTCHINIDLDCIDEDGKPYKYIVAPCDYTLLRFAMQATTEAVFALLLIRCLTTDFLTLRFAILLMLFRRCR